MLTFVLDANGISFQVRHPNSQYFMLFYYREYKFLLMSTEINFIIAFHQQTGAYPSPCQPNVRINRASHKNSKYVQPLISGQIRTEEKVMKAVLKNNVTFILAYKPLTMLIYVSSYDKSFFCQHVVLVPILRRKSRVDCIQSKLYSPKSTQNNS